MSNHRIYIPKHLRKREPPDVVRLFAEAVLENGSKVESRYGSCFEIMGGQLVVPAGILIERKGLNLSIGWMEMYQLAAGVFDLDQLKRVAPNADHSLFTEAMAYGPRINLRIQSIIDTLRINPETRQAVLFIGGPEDGPTSELPCTVTIQFLVRDETIYAIVSMRSWDLCRGLPYDLMMFSGLLMLVGRCLGYTVGAVMVNAGSTHIYEGWTHRLPKTAPAIWTFDRDVPHDWNDIKAWANFGMKTFQNGKLPPGVQISTVSS